LKLIRSHEWWAYKLPPLLALGYATSLSSPVPLYKTAGWLVGVLISVIAGAVYVSVINDITDIRVDLASGKANRMASVPAAFKWIIPAVCIVFGFLFIRFLYRDRLSAWLYAMPWISFSLYSFPPIRLKTRGIWGVIADASGAHLFISLLTVATVSRFTSIAIDWIWFTAVGVWSLACGIRGILGHQFQDRENDLRVNLRTYATGKDPTGFKAASFIILLIECLALAVMLGRIANLYPILFLVLYFILVFIRYKRLGYAVVVILVPGGRPFQVLMDDYYQLFLPLSLLVYGALTQPWAWVVLAIHLLLFPGKMQWAARDLFMASLLRYGQTDEHRRRHKLFFMDDHGNRVRYRWVILLTGVLQLIAGGLVMRHQLGTFSGISWMMGILVILVGINHILFAAGNNKALPAGRWHLSAGILDLIAGIVLLLDPKTTAAVLPVLAGLWFLVRSVSLLVFSFTLRRFSPTIWGVLLTGGILILLLAIFILYNRNLEFVTIMKWIGFALIITGGFNVWLAVRLRMKGDDLGAVIS
jgi:uncharacterized membrane protein HdeD (DUF308 family)